MLSAITTVHGPLLLPPPFLACLRPVCLTFLGSEKAVVFSGVPELVFNLFVECTDCETISLCCCWQAAGLLHKRLINETEEKGSFFNKWFILGKSSHTVLVWFPANGEQLSSRRCVSPSRVPEMATACGPSDAGVSWLSSAGRSRPALRISSCPLIPL